MREEKLLGEEDKGSLSICLPGESEACQLDTAHSCPPSLPCLLKEAFIKVFK